MDEITGERINELIIKEKKLDLLEAGGVGNWDGYQSALGGFLRDQEKLFRRESLLDELIQIFEVLFEIYVYNPTEINVRKDVRKECLVILEKHQVDFEDIDID